MRRIVNVVRLQMINRQTFIWTPLIILAGGILLSVLIFAMVPFGGPKVSGAGQAPLWYFFAIGIGAMTYTFPFSQALSITRRDFFLGTMLTAVLASAFMGVLFLIGAGIEVATHGYGVNGYVFYFDWLWEAGPFGAFVAYFALALGLFVLGFTGATVFKTWGLTVLTISWVVVALLLVGLVFLATRFGWWGAFWDGVVTLGALGMALWGLVVIAGLMGISFLAFRRAVP